jgi:1-acyl-sn-glycerol-3-phosphate acyltransferase
MRLNYKFCTLVSLPSWFTFYQGLNQDQFEESQRPGAIVSNHVSYVDILYHMSASFPSFVAKVLICCS